MGFSINYGSPGILMAILIVFGVAVALIAVYVLGSLTRSAREDVLDEHDPESGDREDA